MACVVTIDTAADGHFAVAVGTGEIQPQADLVDARVETVTQHSIKRVVALTAPALFKGLRKIHGPNRDRVNKKPKNTQGDEIR